MPLLRSAIAATLLVCALLAHASCRDLADAERLRCFDRLAGCAGLADATLRLACFDERSADPSTETAATNDDPEETSGGLRQRAAEALAAFGFGGEDAPAADRDEVARIAATIEAVEKNRLGIDYLTLDNGQVWREIEDYRRHFEAGDRVTIERGTLGSYDLRSEGRKRRLKVRRVR